MNVSLDEHRLGGLRWIVLRGPGPAAFQALGEHTRDAHPVAIPLRDLAEGHPHAQRSFTS
jgi:hypothetical protein